YISIKEALKHASQQLSTNVKIEWLDAETYVDNDLFYLDGILIPGGFGNRGIEGMINAIKYARESKKPLFGICLGFQLTVIEFARNVLGYHDATSTEMSTEGTPIITQLSDQVNNTAMGSTMRLGNAPITLSKGSKLYDLYKSTDIVERHRHRYEVNQKYIDEIESKGLVFTGKYGNSMKALELSGHPYFVATQYHPEFKSRITRPSPPFVGFVKACIEYQLHK
ncbi:MAG TPA: gamma-glutamyl-gamma-aminobutyrate hydrolase family protein, partial [Methanocorpusculum sp.]|nr:gamma-glutamyl-gamma-aminobutyrate hydrolase family protein [Methanocorpusculum sp.]